MACGQCSSGGCGNIKNVAEEKSNHKTTAGCSSGGCSTGGCNKMNSFDWLSNMESPKSSRFGVIEVKFKGGRKEYFKNKSNLDLYTGDFVVCEMPTGFHIGSVSLQGELVRLQMIKKGIKESDELAVIHRLATEKDLEKHSQAINRDLPTMYRTREICKELKLNLKLSEVEFQSDNSKATFFYSADDRVDFRELIKMLAGEFKVRIEMRQISLRQEAGRLGGIGSCGRELCCSTWLSDFKTIPTAAARYQNLSLNPAKLSGQCGRLKCCLNYELETYIDAIRDIPVVDRSLKTEKGDATLQKTDIFRRIMWFSYPNETNWYPINCAQVAEIQKMNAAGKKPVGLENLVEISEFVSAKPTSINNDLERLDKKYHQNKKKSGPKKPNNPNVRNEGNAAKPANPQNHQQPRPNQPNNPNVRNEGNAAKPANPQQPRPNQPRPPQQQTRPNQPRPPLVEGGTASSIPAQTGGNPAGTAEGSTENKSRNKKRKKNRNNNNRPDKPAI
ncbi:stage 0 sporulation family protein [Lacihabitans sp. CS3-21]|uniref:PSP1 domain-containing protein n=1 Tax=Lacihabitans sp. CS3-21 TaxID=2487332 RepID=UPI0038F666E4